MIKKLIVPLKYIWNHPVTKTNRIFGMFRFLKWQIKASLIAKEQNVDWIENLQLNVTKSMHGATGCIYVGLPEFNDMCFLLHYLDTKSTFIDIGANVGVYSLLAGGIKKCNTISIEPIPQTFNYLEKNIALNKLGKIVTCYNIGLSDKEGELYFTKSKDTINHVTNKDEGNAIKVKVDTLDNLLQNHTINKTLIKLDVEGFEYHVLKGAHNTLSNQNLKALIVELNDCSSKFGLTDEMVDQLLIDYKFGKFDYNPFTRKLTKINKFHREENTLYIRLSELNTIEHELMNASPITIYGKKI